MKFIFEVTLKPKATRQQFVDAWKKSSAIINKQPGARGSELYEKIGEDGFLAIASWDSREARDKAMEALRSVDEATRKILDRGMEYGYVKVIGNFEDAEWRVGG